MNDNISTIIIAPMTTRSHAYPTRTPIEFEDKEGWVVLDQIRALDKRRFVKKLGELNEETISFLYKKNNTRNACRLSKSEV